MINSWSPTWANIQLFEGWIIILHRVNSHFIVIRLRGDRFLWHVVYVAMFVCSFGIPSPILSRSGKISSYHQHQPLTNKLAEVSWPATRAVRQRLLADVSIKSASTRENTHRLDISTIKIKERKFLPWFLPNFWPRTAIIYSHWVRLRQCRRPRSILDRSPSKSNELHYNSTQQGSVIFFAIISVFAILSNMSNLIARMPGSPAH